MSATRLPVECADSRDITINRRERGHNPCLPPLDRKYGHDCSASAKELAQLLFGHAALERTPVLAKLLARRIGICVARPRNRLQRHRCRDLRVRAQPCALVSETLLGYVRILVAAQRVLQFAHDVHRAPQAIVADRLKAFEQVTKALAADTQRMQLRRSAVVLGASAQFAQTLACAERELHGTFPGTEIGPAPQRRGRWLGREKCRELAQHCRGALAAQRCTALLDRELAVRAQTCEIRLEARGRSRRRCGDVVLERRALHVEVAHATQLACEPRELPGEVPACRARQQLAKDLERRAHAA